VDEIINQETQESTDKSPSKFKKLFHNKKVIIILIILFLLLTSFLIFRPRQPEIFYYTPSQRSQELSKNELNFIYEIDYICEDIFIDYEKQIECKEKIRLINETILINEKRDIKKDLAFIFNYTQDEISLTQEEALSGNIKFHYGDLNMYRLTSAEGLILPETISGSIIFSSNFSSEEKEILREKRPDLSFGYSDYF